MFLPYELMSNNTRFDTLQGCCIDNNDKCGKTFSFIRYKTFYTEDNNIIIFNLGLVTYVHFFLLSRLQCKSLTAKG